MKKIMARVGTYESNGETKGRWQQVGMMGENDKGPYIMLDPGVSLAGVALKQRIENPEKGGRVVLCGIFEDRQQQRQQGGGDPKPSRGNDDFDDQDIPFITNDVRFDVEFRR